MECRQKKVSTADLFGLEQQQIITNRWFFGNSNLSWCSKFHCFNGFSLAVAVSIYRYQISDSLETFMMTTRTQIRNRIAGLEFYKYLAFRRRKDRA